MDLWITSSVNLRDWVHPRRLNLGVEWENKNRQEGEWNRFRRVGSPRLLVDSKGVFWVAFWLGAKVFITNSSDGHSWRKPVSLGPSASKSAPQSIALCEHADGDVIVAFRGVYWQLKPNRPSPDGEPGLLIGKVSPELQFDRREVTPGFAYTQVRYGWPGDTYPLAMARMSDGRYVLAYVTAGALGLATSRDLKRWEHRSLDRIIPLACAAVSGARLAVVTCSDNDPSVKWYDLGEILSKPGSAEDGGSSGVSP